MKLKKSDFYIIYNDSDGKEKKAVKVSGYIFQKNGHWFSIRKHNPDEKHHKWIISDFVTGLVMTSTDNKLNDVPDTLSDNLIDKFIECYKDDSTSIYRRESTREEFQRYAQLINEAMLHDGKDKLIDLFQDSAYELFR